MSIDSTGKIYIQVEKAGNKTTATQIATILNQTVDFKQGIQTRSQTISDSAVLPTFVLSLFSFPLGGFNTALAAWFRIPDS